MRRLQDVPLPTLSDEELLDHFDDVVRLCTDGLMVHHLLHPAELGFPVRLALFCTDHLGWPLHETLAMLAGLSEASWSVHRSVLHHSPHSARHGIIGSSRRYRANHRVPHHGKPSSAAHGHRRGRAGGTG